MSFVYNILLGDIHLYMMIFFNTGLYLVVSSSYKQKISLNYDKFCAGARFLQDQVADYCLLSTV